MLPESFWTCLPFQLSFVYNSRHLFMIYIFKTKLTILIRSYFVLPCIQVQNCLLGKCYFGILHPIYPPTCQNYVQNVKWTQILFTWANQKLYDAHCIDFDQTVWLMQQTLQVSVHKMLRICLSVVFFLHYCFFWNPEYQFKCKTLKCEVKYEKNESKQSNKHKIKNIPIELFFLLVLFLCNRKYIRNERVFFRTQTWEGL